MAKDNKCSMCGASLRGDSDECEYCGTRVDNNIDNTEGYDIHDDVNKAYNTIRQRLSNIRLTADKPFNWIAFILLLLFIPPIAIIYFICSIIDFNKK